MIKSAGNRISPTEIEDVAVQCSGISEAVALGIPDERLGAAICLLLERHGDLDRAGAQHQLKDYLRTELPHILQTQYIGNVADFPRNPTGKFDRVQLVRDFKTGTASPRPSMGTEVAKTGGVVQDKKT